MHEEDNGSWVGPYDNIPPAHPTIIFARAAGIIARIPPPLPLFCRVIL